MQRFKVLGLCLFVTLLVLSAASAPRVAAESLQNCVFVKETGHNIHGEFLEFYVTHGGAKILGVPLTEAFLEDGGVVQYFTYARLEFVPQNGAPHRIRLGRLGAQYGVTDPPVHSKAVPSLNDPNFRYYAQTGLMIGFAIKDYYDAHNGYELYGMPISQLRYENGIFVQYFQNIRLEWNPTKTGADQVRPTLVGQVALEQRYPSDFPPRAPLASDWCLEASSPRSPSPLTPNLATPSPNSITLDPQLQIRFPQAGTRGPQYIDALVYDRVTGKPVPNVALYAIVQFSQGTRVIPLASTDANGRSTFCFDLGVQPVGAITTVTVHAYLGTLTARVIGRFTHY